jgi:hypothetical protein
MTFTSTELAEKLEVNPTRWKRWSREFIGKDDKAGMRCGYTRKYSYDEALRVYFGSYLLTQVKMSVEEVKTVLGSIMNWLKKKKDSDVKEWHIYIRKGKITKKGKISSDFLIAAKGIIEFTKAKDESGRTLYTESYCTELIRTASDMKPETNLKMIHPAKVVKEFKTKLKIL